MIPSAVGGYRVINTGQKSVVTILIILTEIRPLEYQSKLNRDRCLEFKLVICYKLNKYIFGISPKMY